MGFQSITSRAPHSSPLLLIRLFQQYAIVWGRASSDEWKGRRRRVFVYMLWVCARFRGRAGSGTRPWVASADGGERQIRRDRPAADRGSRRGRFRSAIAGDFRLRGPPKAPPVEPASTCCLRKAIKVARLKSGMTAMRARPLARPRFSTATRTSAAFRPWSCGSRVNLPASLQPTSHRLPLRPVAARGPS